MDSSRKKLLEQLAIFRDLPASERQRLLQILQDDALLREKFEQYQKQDELLSTLEQARPDRNLRTDFYQRLQGPTSQPAPGFLSWLGNVTATAGRVAVAVVSVAIIAAVALVFRGQLQLAGGSGQRPIGGLGETQTPAPTVFSETPLATAFVAPATATVPAYPGVEPTPTVQAPAAYPEPNTTKAAETESEAELVAPVMTPAHIRLDKWSDDGSYLAFWQHLDADFVSNAQFPPGTLSFYARETGDVCTYSRSLYDGAGQTNSRHTWLGDERLLIFNSDGSYTLGAVCTEQLQQSSGFAPALVEQIVTVSGERDTLLVLTTDGYYLVTITDTELSFVSLENVPADPFRAAAFSPDSALLAINGSAGGTTVVDVAAAQIIQRFEWQSMGGLGNIFAPQWLNNQTILVRSSAEVGPLLLAVGGEAEPVGPVHFDLAASPGQVAEGAYLEGEEYAIALYYQVGAEDFAEGVWLTRSGWQDPQLLSEFDRATFTPGGERIVLSVDNENGESSRYAVWWADLGRTSVEPMQLYEGVDFPYTDVGGAEGSVAIMVGNRLLILDGAGNRSQYELPDVTYGGVPSWSPNGRHVASTGGFSGRPETALYIIPAP